MENEYKSYIRNFHVIVIVHLSLVTITALFPVVSYYLMRDNWQYFWFGNYRNIFGLLMVSCWIFLAVIYISYGNPSEILSLKFKIISGIYGLTLLVICLWHMYLIELLKPDLIF